MQTLLIKILFLISVAVLLFSCSSNPALVDYDNSVDFSSLKTYQWDIEPSADFSKSNPLVAKRIVSAIEKGLQKKGFLKAEAADVKISYQVVIEKRFSSTKLSTGMGMSVGGGGRGYIGLSSGNQAKKITEGTLLIDMTSITSNRLIWRSKKTQPLKEQDKSPEESQESINQIVSDMLENFPPNKDK